VKRLAGLGVLAVLLASTSLDAKGDSAAEGSEAEAVKAVISATTEAFNRHDARAWAQLSTPDARLVTVRGESMSGAREIENGLQSIFKARARNATLRTLDVTVKFIRPDVALAHVTNEMSGIVAPDGTAMPPHQELSIRVLVKDAGAWRIAAFHNTILQR
jgi:uncharacterized protein (TIGR02246 family)